MTQHHGTRLLDKPEQWYWRNRLRPVLASIPGLHYDRVESRTCVGIPDIHITTAAGHGWIEMKVGQIEDSFVKVSTLTAVQAKWIYSRGQMCGRVWLIVWDPRPEVDYTLLFDHLIGKNIRKDRTVPTNLAIRRGVSRMDWEKILL